SYVEASQPWGAQAIVPPAGLVTSRTDTMVGATASTRTSLNTLTVEAVLIDPSDNRPDYIVARPRGSATVVAIPPAAITHAATGLYVDATDYTIGTLPHMTVAQLEATYAPAVAAVPPPVYTPAPVGPVAPVPPVVPTIVPTSGPTHLVHRGNVVGYQVVDS